MDTKILIAYASGSGSTGEVAEAVAAEIEKEGLRTVVQNVSEVDSIASYSGVVIGSSIRIGAGCRTPLTAWNALKPKWVKGPLPILQRASQWWTTQKRIDKPC